MKNLFTNKNNKGIATMLLIALMTATVAGCGTTQVEIPEDTVVEQEVLDAQVDEEVEEEDTEEADEAEITEVTPEVDDEAARIDIDDEAASVVIEDTEEEETIVYEPVTITLQDGTEVSLDGEIAAIGMTETGKNIRNTVCVNVRDYPGTSGNKYYAAAVGSEVYEIAKLDNGWSVIEYNGGYAFSNSSYWVNSEDYVEPVVAEPEPTETVSATSEETASAEVEATADEVVVEQTAEAAVEVETTVEVTEATTTETATTVTSTAAAEIAANTNLYGHYMYGRCTIPSVGMSVAIYVPGTFNAIYNSQSVVDTADAAAVLSYSWSGDSICSMSTEEWMVADHKNQAFSLLKSVSVGDHMYIDRGDAGVDEYVCVSIQNGINNYGSEYWGDKSSGLYTMDGTRCSSLNQGGLVFYTCQENYLHVLLVFWQPV